VDGKGRSFFLTDKSTGKKKRAENRIFKKGRGWWKDFGG